MVEAIIVIVVCRYYNSFRLLPIHSTNVLTLENVNISVKTIETASFFDFIMVQ